MKRSARKLRRWMVAGLALAVGVPVAVPGAANAVTTQALPDGQWLIVTGTHPSPTPYNVRTTAPYWSAVLLVPGFNSNSDYDLSLHDSDGTTATSTLGEAQVDYVAIDSNIRSVQTHFVDVHRYSGNTTGEQYRIVFLDGKSVLNPGQTRITPPGTADGKTHGFIRDIFLNAGQRITLTVGQDGVPCSETIGTLYLNMWLLASDPSNAASALQGAPSAAATGTDLRTRDGACSESLAYTAPRGAWYGLLVEHYFANAVVTLSVS